MKATCEWVQQGLNTSEMYEGWILEQRLLCGLVQQPQVLSILQAEAPCVTCRTGHSSSPAAGS